MALGGRGVWLADCLGCGVSLRSSVFDRIHLPSGTIEVEDGCSGHNFFMAATVIGLLQAYWLFTSFSRRVAVVLLAMLVGMVSNWVRVILLVLIAYKSEMRNELIYDHVNFGWMVFTVALVIYFGLSRLLLAGDPLPVRREQHAASQPLPWSRMAAFAVIGMSILAVFPVWLHWQSQRSEVGSQAGLPAPSRAARSLPVEWWPQYEGFDVRQSWQVSANDATYDVVALTYLQQRRDKKLIYFRNRIAEEYQILQPQRTQRIDGVEVKQLAVNLGTGSRAVWWFYVIDGRITADNYVARGLLFTAFMRGDTRASLVAISTPCEQKGCDRELQQPATEILLRQILDQWADGGALRASPIAARENG
jgi:exosortase/archaeosortase family protein